MNTKYSNKYGNLIIPDLIGSVLNVPFDAKKFQWRKYCQSTMLHFQDQEACQVLKYMHDDFYFKASTPFICIGPEASHKLIPVLITVYFKLTTKSQAW